MSLASPALHLFPHVEGGGLRFFRFLKNLYFLLEKIAIYLSHTHIFGFDPPDQLSTVEVTEEITL